MREIKETAMNWHARAPLWPWYYKMPAYALAFASVAALSALVTFLVMSRHVTVQVPDIKGRSLPDAARLLNNVGLSIKVAAEVTDRYVPSGHVIVQGTEAGSRVKGRPEVIVLLSKGPEVRLIPDVTGVSLAEAERILTEEGLVIDRTIRVHSESVKRDRVIAQRPAPEEWTGETITLVASAGARDIIYYSPSFKGMLREDAALLASGLGLKVVFTGKADAETIVGQRPDPGSEIKTGSTVYLAVGG